MSDGPTDHGMQLCGQINSEDELQEWLEKRFEDAGWTAIREVSPHRSNYRADLIVEHDNFGWFGIETKFIGKSQGPIDMAKAHHQITQKYRGKKYINNKIDLWAVCPYIKYGSLETLPRDEQNGENNWRRRKRTQVYDTRVFFQHSGIGWIELDTYSLEIEFIESDSQGSVPVGYLAPTEKVQRNRDRYAGYVGRRREDCDIERIREWAAGKVENAPYGRSEYVIDTA
jgi:hypothetical protein